MTLRAGLALNNHEYVSTRRTFDSIFCLFAACERSVVAIRMSLDLERYKAILTPFCICITRCFMSSKNVHVRGVQVRARQVSIGYCTEGRITTVVHVPVTCADYSKDRREPMTTPTRLTAIAFRCKRVTPDT
jgi:hypothetical protein